MGSGRDLGGSRGNLGGILGLSVKIQGDLVGQGGSDKIWSDLGGSGGGIFGGSDGGDLGRSWGDLKAS